jgi:hypothetical protein
VVGATIVIAPPYLQISSHEILFLLKGLLSGGAHIIVTTSRYSRATVEYYQSILQSFGRRGSALIIVPFNKGSKRDMEALVDYTVYMRRWVSRLQRFLKTDAKSMVPMINQNSPIISCWSTSFVYWVPLKTSRHSTDSSHPQL